MNKAGERGGTSYEQGIQDKDEVGKERGGARGEGLGGRRGRGEGLEGGGSGRKAREKEGVGRRRSRGGGLGSRLGLFLTLSYTHFVCLFVRSCVCVICLPYGGGGIFDDASAERDVNAM